MRRVFFSILFSFISSALVGLLLAKIILLPFEQEPGFSYRIALKTAAFFSLLLNLLFFYIRRWDGCIEKLGGLTFSFFLLLAAISPLSLIGCQAPFPLSKLVLGLILILTIQFFLIGWVTTVFLRTKNFKPLKPGETLKW